jgi:bifunctional N-acetylglucosamine-1-phosphate-uridyltransferase/glucosamine-1-phosphate-acetyltransferase GlmU-like protein
MKSQHPKVLHAVCGRPMLSYVLAAASAVSERRPLVVISPATESIRDAIGDEVDYAVQAEPRGTADAATRRCSAARRSQRCSGNAGRAPRPWRSRS